MRRRSRATEIFSLSALDLFASALGVFVILTAILLPYYPNMKDGGLTVQRLLDTIADRQEETEDAKRRQAEIEAEIEKRRRDAEQAAEASAARAAIRAQIARVEAGSASLEGKVGGLQDKLAALRGELAKRAKATSAPGTTDFSILGITTKAKSIMLIVDLSGSMSKWGSLLVDTLQEILVPFDDGIRFSIIGFQSTGVSVIWPGPNVMAVADARSKASARAFISTLSSKFRGVTPTEVALLYALSHAGRQRLESVILVSDGAPSGKKTPQQIIDTITRLNGGRVEINTVALGDYLIGDHQTTSSYMQFLNNLSKRNRGSFVGVLP